MSSERAESMSFPVCGIEHPDGGGGCRLGEGHDSDSWHMDTKGRTWRGPAPRLDLVAHMREQIRQSPEKYANEGKLRVVAERLREELSCDDGGTCHHDCEDGDCFRRRHASPLSVTGCSSWAELDKRLREEMGEGA